MKRRGQDPGWRRQAAERLDQVLALPMLVLTVVFLAVLVLPVIYLDLPAGLRVGAGGDRPGHLDRVPCRIPGPAVCGTRPVAFVRHSDEPRDYVRPGNDRGTIDGHNLTCSSTCTRAPSTSHPSGSGYETPFLIYGIRPGGAPLSGLREPVPCCRGCLVPVHDTIQAHRGVPQAGQGADDQQVDGEQRLGMEQVAQEGHIEPGELQRQRDGGGQGRVG